MMLLGYPGTDLASATTACAEAALPTSWTDATFVFAIGDPAVVLDAAQISKGTRPHQRGRSMPPPRLLLSSVKLPDTTIRETTLRKESSRPATREQDRLSEVNRRRTMDGQQSPAAHSCGQRRLRRIVEPTFVAGTVSSCSKAPMHVVISGVAREQPEL